MLWQPAKAGLFWTAANPAGLVAAITEPRTDFLASAARERGSYRRPLDPGGRDLRQLFGQSWGRLNDRFALLGRVAINQETADPGARADEIEAYPSSPFVSADSATSGTRQTMAQLEGAAGWRLREWSLGAALGYQARDRETIQSGLVRRTSLSGSGLIVGLSRRVASLTIGVHGGFRARSEVVEVFERTQRGQVVQFEGYREVTPIEVSRQNPYYGRIDEGEGWGGIAVEHQGARGQWVAFAERSALRERRTRQEQDRPPLDRWEPNGWRAGGAVTRRLGSQTVATVSVQWRALRGVGTIARDTTTFQATADEGSGILEAEVRRTVTGSRAAWAVGLGWWYQHRTRGNTLPDVAADIRSATPTLWGEVLVPIGGRVMLSNGGSVSRYNAASRLPDARSQGLEYQRYLAPELALEAHSARPVAFKFGLQYQATPRTRVWVAGRVERLSPGGAGPTAFLPPGQRTATSLVLGTSTTGR